MLSLGGLDFTFSSPSTPEIERVRRNGSHSLPDSGVATHYTQSLLRVRSIHLVWMDKTVRSIPLALTSPQLPRSILGVYNSSVDCIPQHQGR
jgi:hypothetical protein